MILIRIRTGLMAILLIALAVAAGCGQRSSVVLEKPLRNVVKTESNSLTLMAWADAGVKADVLIHIDSTDDLALFPTSLHETIENTADHLERKNSAVVNRIATIVEKGGIVNIGRKAGMYERVIWVLPVPGSVTDLPLENFKQALMTRRGYPAAELADFAVSGKHITGTVAGVPLTVTSLEDIELEGETALLDIDLTYFTGMQAASADYKPGTASLLNFLRVLKRKKIPAVMATINRASVFHAPPLDIRYYADIIEEIFVDPSLLEGTLPEKYSMMIEAEKLLSEGHYGEAAALYAGLARSYPDNAGLHFSHAFALGFLDKGVECREAMVRAYGIDAVYMRGFFQLARVLGANGRLSAGEALLETSDLSKTLSKNEMEYQRALFYMQAGLYHQAAEILVDVTGRRPKDFAIKTILYRAYEELGETQKMYRVLDGLVRLDRDRVVRDMPWAFKKLGDLAWNIHLDPVAASWYKQYLVLFPDDPDAGKMRELIEKWEDVDPRPTAVE